MASAGGEPPRPPRVFCEFCQRPGHLAAEFRVSKRAASLNMWTAFHAEGLRNLPRGTRAGKAKQAKKARRQAARTAHAAPRAAAAPAAPVSSAAVSGSSAVSTTNPAASRAAPAQGTVVPTNPGELTATESRIWDDYRSHYMAQAAAAFQREVLAHRQQEAPRGEGNQQPEQGSSGPELEMKDNDEKAT